MVGEVGSTVPRRQLGRHLKELRVAAHMTLKTAARALEWSEAKMSRIEAGHTSVRVHDARAMCEVYGAPSELAEALVGLARETKAKGWWHAYGDVIPEGFDVFIGLEAAATEIDWYESDLVPGLFQTEDYYRVVLRAWAELAPDEVERRVAVRMQRQAILTRPVQAVQLRAVLSETVIRYPIGGPAVMGAQVRQIIELSERPNVQLRVIPHDAAMHQGVLTGQFGILRFPATGPGVREPDTVYADGYLGDLYLDGDQQVARYGQAYSDIWGKALNEQATRDLLRQAVGSYEQHA